MSRTNTSTDQRGPRSKSWNNENSYHLVSTYDVPDSELVPSLHHLFNVHRKPLKWLSIITPILLMPRVTELQRSEWGPTSPTPLQRPGSSDP